jgi:hypothetical protein
MKDKLSKREPSEELTNYVNDAYAIYQRKLKAGRTEDKLAKEKAVLDQRILDLIDQGYTVLTDSKYGIAVIQESETPQYKALYQELVRILAKKFPEHKEDIAKASQRLIKNTLKSTKRNIFYDSTQGLDKKIASIEASEKKREGIKAVQLAIYP